MTTLDIRDTNPPYHFPAYQITEHRSPRREVMTLPEWYGHAPGPSHGRIPVSGGSNDLNTQHAGQPIGQRIVLFGRVLDRAGQPVPDALLEIWQVNGAGRYADPADPAFFPLDPNFTGAGRCLTDEEGRFRFFTLRPAAYPGQRGGLYRPSHIHISVFGEDLSSRLITQCYFPDDPLLPRDPIVNAIGEDGVDRLTARFVGEMTEPHGGDSALAYEYDIVLRGRRRGPAMATDEPAANFIGVLSASQTIGPLYGFALMFDGSEKAADPDDPSSIVVEGTVWDGRGAPVTWPDCMLEIWQGDQFARTRTDRDGRYRAVLHRPASAGEGPAQAPHLEVTVFARGLLKQAQTRLYFPDEAERNAADPVLAAMPVELRPRLIAGGSGRNFTFDIHLQGPSESVFFGF